MALSKIDVANMLTGVAPVANGGTGLSSGTTDQFLKFTGSTTLASAADNAGITVAGQWRWTVSRQNDYTPISADWEEVDTQYSRVGSAMTQSSGVFTFPSTGVYFITYQTYFNAAVGETEINALIQHTTNNGGAWSDNTKFACGEANDGGYVGGYGSTVIDIGDVSNHKVRFTVDMSNTATNMIGDSSRNQVAVTFIRLGDT